MNATVHAAYVLGAQQQARIDRENEIIRMQSERAEENVETRRTSILAALRAAVIRPLPRVAH